MFVQKPSPTSSLKVFVWQPAGSDHWAVSGCVNGRERAVRDKEEMRERGRGHKGVSALGEDRDEG